MNPLSKMKNIITDKLKILMRSTVQEDWDLVIEILKSSNCTESDCYFILKEVVLNYWHPQDFIPTEYFKFVEYFSIYDILKIVKKQQGL